MAVILITYLLGATYFAVFSTLAESSLGQNKVFFCLLHPTIFNGQYMCLRYRISFVYQYV